MSTNSVNAQVMELDLGMGFSGPTLGIGYFPALSTYWGSNGEFEGNFFGPSLRISYAGYNKGTPLTSSFSFMTLEFVGKRISTFGPPSTMVGGGIGLTLGTNMVVYPSVSVSVGGGVGPVFLSLRPQYVFMGYHPADIEEGKPSARSFFDVSLSLSFYIEKE